MRKTHTEIHLRNEPEHGHKQDADQKEHHAIRNTVGKEDGEVKGSKPWILSQTHRSHAVVHGMVYLHGHIRLLPEQDKTLYPCGPA